MKTPIADQPGGHRYSSDRPIRSQREDLLDRTNFAERLASDIRAWSGRDSLVVGLYGSWGCGKTSLKNLILACLGKGRKKMTIVDFNPWQMSGTGNIAAAFFGELRAALGKVDSSAEATQRAERLERYATRLSLGGTAVAKVGSALGYLGIPGSEYVKVAGKGIKQIGAVTQEGSKAAKSGAAEPSLSQLKGELSESLAKMQWPVLVVIDDIDRLTTAEVREVFQLTKANADFPNLIYLLLFERSIVSQALDEISGGRGYEFLEKIVQVGYHVPHASRDAVHKVLFHGLDETLKLPGVDARWDADRWGALYRDGLVGYFRNLRHVYRYLASFDFHVRQFRRGPTFEVNPVDLIALEALRVFESDVYERLPASKRILTRDEGARLFGEISQDVIDTAVDQIVSSIPEPRRSAAKRLLELIFPPITSNYAGRDGVSRDQQDWLRQARVCHPDLFDKYFTLVVPENDLSQVELDRLIGSANDQAIFTKECRAFQRRGLLKIAFERADAFRNDIPVKSMPTLLRALCNLSDEFEEPSPGSGFISVDLLTIAWRLVYFGLSREKNKAKRFEIVKSALRDCGGILLPLDIVQTEERTKEREEKGYEFLLEQADLPELKKICLEKVRKAAKTGILRKHPRADDVLFRWGALSSLDEIREWLATQIETAEGAAWALSLMMTRVSSGGKTRSYIKLSFVEKYADVETLEKKVADINEAALSEQQSIAVGEFKRAMRRKREGKPELDGYRRFEDDEE